MKKPEEKKLKETFTIRMTLSHLTRNSHNSCETRKTNILPTTLKLNAKLS
jgi:hypothetical protein